MHRLDGVLRLRRTTAERGQRDRGEREDDERERRQRGGAAQALAARAARCARDPAHALEQRTSVRRHGQRETFGAQLLEARERPRVLERVAAHGDREVVAAVLALHAHAARDPPHGRVVEQQRLDDRLQQVDEEVVPPDVRELVRQDHLELRRRQPGHRARRKKDRRAHEPDHRGHGHRRGLEQAHEPLYAQRRAETARRILHGVGRGCAADDQPARAQPLAQEAQREQRDAEDPQGDQRGQYAVRGARELLHEIGSGRGRLSDRRGCSRGRRDANRDRHGRVRAHGGRDTEPGDQQERRTRERVAQFRAAAGKQCQRGGEEARDQRALPEKMKQRPADGLGERARRECEVHCGFLSSSWSSSARMSRSSSRVARRPERACRTSLADEPAKARSTRSESNCSCVRCSLSFGP
jgi:hypothetical protein